MKKQILSEIGWTLAKIALGSAIAGFLILALSSCRANRQIVHTPTHREIKRAMSYSTSEYIMPCIKEHYSHHPISNR
jgi:hypothetical protein